MVFDRRAETVGVDGSGRDDRDDTAIPDQLLKAQYRGRRVTRRRFGRAEHGRCRHPTDLGRLRDPRCQLRRGGIAVAIEFIDDDDRVHPVRDALGTGLAPLESHLVARLILHASTISSTPGPPERLRRARASRIPAGRVLTPGMHVQLKLTLAASPEIVRDALANPAVMVAVTKPLLVYRSEEPEGFPRRWTTSAERVGARILGVFPLGRTHVSLRWYEVDGFPDTVVQEDTGRGIDGTFTLLRIRHRMAVSPAPHSSGLANGTLLRDRMEFHAGPLGPVLWPGLWLVWQWRGFRMKQLAPTWTLR